MDDLVERLATGKHFVEFEQNSKDYSEIRNRLFDLNFVFIKFRDTSGGTELGINIEHSLSDLSQANFSNGTGSMHIVGTCVLNYVKVRCVVDIELESKSGNGYLEIITPDVLI